MLTHPIKNNESNIFIQKFTTIAVKKRQIGVETKIVCSLTGDGSPSGISHPAILYRYKSPQLVKTGREGQCMGLVCPYIYSSASKYSGGNYIINSSLVNYPLLNHSSIFNECMLGRRAIGHRIDAMSLLAKYPISLELYHLERQNILNVCINKYRISRFCPEPKISG